MRLKRYQKDWDQSYAFGFFSVRELLRHRPDQVRRILLHPRGDASEAERSIRREAAALGIATEEDPRTLERLAPRESCLAAAVFAKYPMRFDPALDTVVLAEPADMGNLGSILRSAVGFGLPQLALIRPAADCWDPKVVRASMGALFQAQVTYHDSFEALTRSLAPSASLAALALSEDARPVEAIRELPRPRALVFGNEGKGLPPEILEPCEPFRIHHLNTVDSLNLGVAAAITFHELVKDQPGFRGR